MTPEDIGGNQNNTGAYYFRFDLIQMTCPLVLKRTASDRPGLVPQGRRFLDQGNAQSKKGGLADAFRAETNRPVMVNRLGFSSRNNDSGPTQFHTGPD